MWLTKWNSEQRVEELTEFFKQHADFKNKSILDIGCNTGHFTRAAFDLGAASVTSIDRLEKYTELTKKLCHNCCTITSDIFDYDMPEFDIIICCGVIYHTERQLELLQKMKQSANIVFLEGLCNRSNKRRQFLKTTPHGLTWVPSRTFYHELIKFAGFTVLEERFFKKRIAFALS